ncbi:MAG TPA: hypothetical protein VF283_06820 [Bryobacteraceae bacterium]
MRKALVLALLALGVTGMATAAEVQGVVVAWSCAKRMVKNGRQQTLKQHHSCSLVGKYNRAAYGVITAKKKYYLLDGNGAQWARTLLKDSPDKDNLMVVVRGKVQGDTIQVKGMTEL